MNFSDCSIKQYVFFSRAPKITCEIDSICVHGDGKLALDIAISLRQNLIQEGFILKPLNQLNKFKEM